MINFNCKNPAFRTLLEAYMHKAIPITQKIGVLNVLYGDHESICKFLETSIPQQQPEFWFNYCSPLVVGTTFLNSLSLAASKVIRYFGVYQVRLVNEEFCMLLNAASHCKEIAFVECDLDTDEECNFNNISKSNLK